ncbi:A24 family peptidase [Kitasatospora kazusensis]
MIGALIGTAVGLAASPVLRAAAARYSVPYGEPLQVCCPRGRYRLPPSGSCPGCGQRGGPRAGLVELAAAGAGAAIGAAAHWPVAPVLVWAGLFGVVLGFVDAAVFRLPDALTLPLAAGTAVLLVTAGLTEHQGGVLLRCLYAGLAFGACYGALALLAPMGFGDAKLAPSLGALLGWYGWHTVLAGFFYGFLLAALWGGALLLAGRSGRGASIAFGPAMLLGALLAVLTAV